MDKQITVEQPPYAAKIDGKDNVIFDLNRRAIIRKVDKGHERFIVKHIELGTLSGSGEFALATLFRFLEGVNDSKVDYVKIEPIQDYPVTVMEITGWVPAEKEHVEGVLAIAAWQKQRAAEIKKADKLEKEARKLRAGY